MSRTQSLNKQIFALAWPAIVSNITTPLLGLVDTAIAGHLGSAVVLAAIALGSTMFNLIYWLLGFLRMTTTGLTAQAFGAEDLREQNIVFYRAVILAVVIGLLLLIFGTWLGDAILVFLDADDAAQPLAEKYFNILIWGALPVMVMFVCNGWLIGMQNTRLPMVIAILNNIVNIAASAVLVFVFDLGIRGIAFGTLISQWLAAIICLVSIFHSYPCIAVSKSVYKSIWEKSLSGFAKMMRLNSDIFLRTLCMVAVTAWFTRAGSTQGVDILAANALLMQFFMLFSYFSDGYASAGEALAGRYSGKNNCLVFKNLIYKLMLWGGVTAIIFTIVYFLCGEMILGILTDRKDVVSVAREYLPWAASVPLAGFAAFVYDGVAVGVTATRKMLLSVFAGMIIYFVTYFVLKSWMGNHALWLSFIIYLLMRGIILHNGLKLNKG